MTIHQIKHCITGEVLFEQNCDSLRACVGAAVKAGANLFGANLAGANLARAYLAGANLADADLVGAYLAGANLAGANLADADLDGANLDGANLAGVHDAIPLGQPNGWHAFAWHQKGVMQIRVGCRSMTLAEGRDYWAGKDRRHEVLAALDYAEAVAALRGWPLSSPKSKAAQPHDTMEAPITPRHLIGEPGMTLRDWFAGQALIGAGTWTPSVEISGEHAPASLTSLTEHDGRRLRAEWAYAQADAMLEARKT